MDSETTLNKDYIKQDLLDLLLKANQENIKNGEYLLTTTEINSQNNTPCYCLYRKFFGGLNKAYELTGINYKEYTDKVSLRVVVRYWLRSFFINGSYL